MGDAARVEGPHGLALPRLGPEALVPVPPRHGARREEDTAPGEVFAGRDVVQQRVVVGVEGVGDGVTRGHDGVRAGVVPGARRVAVGLRPAPVGVRAPRPAARPPRLRSVVRAAGRVRHVEVAEVVVVREARRVVPDQALHVHEDMGAGALGRTQPPPEKTRPVPAPASVQADEVQGARDGVQREQQHLVLRAALVAAPLERGVHTLPVAQDGDAVEAVHGQLCVGRDVPQEGRRGPGDVAPATLDHALVSVAVLERSVSLRLREVPPVREVLDVVGDVAAAEVAVRVVVAPVTVVRPERAGRPDDAAPRLAPPCRGEGGGGVGREGGGGGGRRERPLVNVGGVSVGPARAAL